ncbi:hypothetical protein KA078_00525 [Candidatus Woesebacteria bacterium]|nr:hypothetical protein [Candidatus Woesebacteria bacterium]
MITELSLEQIGGAISRMKEDALFSRHRNELTLQQSRHSRMKRADYIATTTKEQRDVDKNRLAYDLLALAALVGIENFLLYIGVETESK